MVTAADSEQQMSGLIRLTTDHSVFNRWANGNSGYRIGDGMRLISFSCFTVVQAMPQGVLYSKQAKYAGIFLCFRHAYNDTHTHSNTLFCTT